MGIEYVCTRGGYVFHRTGDENCVIATARYKHADRFDLEFNPINQLPFGISYSISNVSIKTCEWLALAIAEHNGVA